ncbi:hypothetical protein HMPREF1207_05088 [Paenibacillus sp. HGH0039]|nr:hypothetical protein HMPREF1207_05088 [Paenibacillus sp. HGH0039]
MKVIIILDDSVYGKTTRQYDFPGLKRSAAICRAVNKVRDDHSLRMFQVTKIRTAR